MLLIDTQARSFIKDEELKLNIARQRPLETWLKELFTLKDLREAHSSPLDTTVKRRGVLLESHNRNFSLVGRAKVLEDRRLALFAYTTETLNLLVLPMIKTEYVIEILFILNV